MSRQIIIADLAYKGPQRKGRGTGRQGMRATLKYLENRDKKTKHVATNHD